MSFLYRQDVVYVVTGRYSRSAKFATSSELLYVVQLLPSECCDEYNTYTTLSEEFRVVFRFTHTSTFELIPSCLGFPGALVTSGGETALSRETRREADSDVAEQRTLIVQHTGHYDGTKETAEYLISTVRRASARRSASGGDGGRCAGPCPAVRRCVDH